MNLNKKVYYLRENHFFEKYLVSLFKPFCNCVCSWFEADLCDLCINFYDSVSRNLTTSCWWFLRIEKKSWFKVTHVTINLCRESKWCKNIPNCSHSHNFKKITQFQTLSNKFTKFPNFQSSVFYFSSTICNFLRRYLPKNYPHIQGIPRPSGFSADSLVCSFLPAVYFSSYSEFFPL